MTLKSFNWWESEPNALRIIGHLWLLCRYDSVSQRYYLGEKAWERVRTLGCYSTAHDLIEAAWQYRNDKPLLKSVYGTPRYLSSAQLIIKAAEHT